MLFPSYFISFLLTVSAVLAHPYARAKVRDDSLHWAGVVARGDSDGTFSDVTTTFRTPSITGPFTSNSSFAIETGLDDEGCPNGYVRVGIDVLLDENGNISYQAWSMWHPWGGKETFNMSVSAGDEIKVTLSWFQVLNSVIAIVENLTTHQIRSTGLASGHAVCGQNIAVVIAPYHPEVTIANFGTVIFTNGTVYNAATDKIQTKWLWVLRDLVQNSKVTARSPDDALRIEYVG